MSILKVQSRRVGGRKFNIAALMPRLFFFIASVIGSQVLLTGSASSVTVGDYSAQAGATVVDNSFNATNPFGTRTEDKEGGGLAASAPSADAGIPGGNGTASVSLGPQPAVSASAGGSSGALPNPFTGATSINASAGASIIYYMGLQGPPGPVNSVPYGLLVGIGTASSGGETGNASASIDVTPFGNNDLDNINVHIGGANGFGFSGVVPLMLTPGDVYQVVLQAGAAGFGPGGSGSAFADPYIFFDLALDPSFTGDPSLYTIILSDGIGNEPPPGFLGSSPVVTTPLPGALPMFATGLGALGLLGWRRKRKAAA